MNEHLCRLISKVRQSKGLNFGNLSDLLGYKNKSKWANKICILERDLVPMNSLIISSEF